MSLDPQSDVMEAFHEQLTHFKNSLIPLYKEKAKLVSERESLRFKYLGAMKVKIDTVMNSILSQAFLEGNQAAIELLTHYFKALTLYTPMPLLNGANREGWGPNAYSFGGLNNVGWLSPMEHFISEPMNYPHEPEQRPAYQIYGEQYIRITNDEIFAREWITSPAVPSEDASVWYLNSIPPSKEWVESYLSYAISGMIIKSKEELLDAYPAFVNLLTKTYPAGTLAAVYDEAHLMLEKIYNLTRRIIQLQMQVDQTESDLKEFVNQYKEYLGSMTALDILHCIDLEADSSKVNQQYENPQCYSAMMMTSPFPAVVEQPVAEVAEPKKSSWPFIMAAAGIFALTRKD